MESGLSAHVSASDVVYSRDIHESYHKTISETGADAIFQIGRQAMVTGSFYLLANSRTESLLKKWIAQVKPLLLPTDLQDHEQILHGLKKKAWRDCLDRPSCSDVKAEGLASVYRHHNVFHCLPRPMHDYSPCSTNRILFTQPLCSETGSTKYEALKEYGLWFLTDCTTTTNTCERIPAEFVTGRKRTDLYCSDRTATLTWQSGSPARWDHMRGSLWDNDAFSKLTHGEPMFALKETGLTAQIVGV